MYQEVLGAFLELKDLLQEKKEAIIHKDLDKLSKIDENTVMLNEKISQFEPEKMRNTFSDEQKQELKALGKEIKILQENNEILIKHSINVINNILSGILNIVDKDNVSYNSEGRSLTDSESLNISSITEEA